MFILPRHRVNNNFRLELTKTTSLHSVDWVGISPKCVWPHPIDVPNTSPSLRPALMAFSSNLVTPIINHSLQTSLKSHWTPVQPPVLAALSQEHRDAHVLLEDFIHIYIWACIFKKWIRCQHLKVTFYIKIFISLFLNKKIWQRNSLVAQRVKDPTLSLQWLGSLLWRRFSLWSGNFHMPWVFQKNKKDLAKTAAMQWLSL